jgi:uncharacterized protein YjbI with pentapeptide repeats
MRNWTQHIFVLIVGVGLGAALAFSVVMTPSVQSASEMNLSRREALQVIARPLPLGQKPGFYLVGVDFSDAQLDTVDLRFAVLRHSSFAGALVENAYLTGADFTESNLSHASFRFTDLKGGILIDANLTETRFFFANLSNAVLIGANLTGADFADALMEGATLPDGSKYESGMDLVTMFGAASNPSSY